MAFSANGEYLLTGDDKSVRVWRIEGGEQVATMQANVLSLAVSKDGRWIAAGTLFGCVFVWDAITYEQVIGSHKEAHYHYHSIGVDFAPDSTRLVSASHEQVVSIWDLGSHLRKHPDTKTVSSTREPVQTLDHGALVIAAKYSPQGNQIATASNDSVRVWDSNDGHSLMDIEVTVIPWYNTGLLWFNNHIFVISDSTIKEFEASTGLAVSEWPVPDGQKHSSIALPTHGKFIVYSTQRTVTFWNTATQATHTQLGLIHPQDICSVAVSPDDRFLAIGGRDGNITINSLSDITVSILSRWIVVHMNIFLPPIKFSTAFDPLVSSTPYIPGTGHSD